jgi:hypothetical protein
MRPVRRPLLRSYRQRASPAFVESLRPYLLVALLGPRRCMDRGAGERHSAAGMTRPSGSNSPVRGLVRLSARHLGAGNQLLEGGRCDEYGSSPLNAGQFHIMGWSRIQPGDGHGDKPRRHDRANTALPFTHRSNVRRSSGESVLYWSKILGTSNNARFRAISALAERAVAAARARVCPRLGTALMPDGDARSFAGSHTDLHPERVQAGAAAIRSS